MTKRRYEGNLSGFATGFVFLFVGIISLILNSLDVDFIGLKFWGYWLFIPAFFILLGSVGQLSTDRRLRKEVLVAIQERQAGKYKLEDIALEVGIKPGDLLRVLLDLRTAGQVTYKYDADSGELLLGQQSNYQPHPQFQSTPAAQPSQAPSGDNKYCPYCGQSVAANAKFCEHCGSKLQ